MAPHLPWILYRAEIGVQENRLNRAKPYVSVRKHDTLVEDHGVDSPIRRYRFPCLIVTDLLAHCNA